MSSLSTHLLNSLNMAVQHNTQSGNPTQMVYSGPMSYNASAHGVTNLPFPLTPFPALLDPSTLPPEPTYHDISIATHKQIATLQAKLDQKLGPEYISQRPGPGGGPKLTYAEGWKIINLANEIFGFNGWSSNICSLSVDYLDPVDDGKRWNCGVSAVVRVTLKDGVYHEDIGYGVAENIKGKGTALDKCKKEAITDAIKRTLRNFGNLLGNCLYDKQYTQEVVKIKVQPQKLDRRTLHRRPEFEEGHSRDTGSEHPSNPPNNHRSCAANNSVAPQLPQGNSGKEQPVKCRAEPSGPQTLVMPPAGKIRPKLEVTTPVQDLKTELNHSTDQEEASYFNSEDDAYFMQVDMTDDGVVSLEEDRPIHLEGDCDDSQLRSNPPQVKNENIKPFKCDTANNSGQQEIRKLPPAPNVRQPDQRPQQANKTILQESEILRAPNSLGGFHFPSSLDISPHVTGVKRGVDSISNPSGNFGREAVIQAALRAHSKSTDIEGKQREPLAPLTGNTVKRLRR